MKDIHTRFMKLGSCPNCGNLVFNRQCKWLPKTILEQWELNDGTIVDGEPICDICAKIITDEDRKWIMACTRAKWTEEIREDKQLTPEQKIAEINRVSKIDFVKVLKSETVK